MDAASQRLSRREYKRLLDLYEAKKKAFQSHVHSIYLNIRCIVKETLLAVLELILLHPSVLIFMCILMGLFIIGEAYEEYYIGDVLPGVGDISYYIADALQYAEEAFLKIIHYLKELATLFGIHISEPTEINFFDVMYVDQMEHPYKYCIHTDNASYYSIISLLVGVMIRTQFDWLVKFYSRYPYYRDIFVLSSVYDNRDAFCVMVNLGYYISSASFLMMILIIIAIFARSLIHLIMLSIDILYTIPIVIELGLIKISLKTLTSSDTKNVD